MLNAWEGKGFAKMYSNVTIKQFDYNLLNSKKNLIRFYYQDIF